MKDAKVFVDAAVYAMHDDASPPAEAIAIAEGRIVAVGRKDDVLGRAGAGAEVISLSGKAIVPGFIDPHHHLSFAVFFDGCIACTPDVCASTESLVARLREASAALPEDAWVFAHGYDDLALGRHPTRRELDDACGGRAAVLLHYSCHEGVASTRALERAGLWKERTDPPGGVVVRDRRGQPTGHLIERALSGAEASARADVLARGGAADFVERLPAYEQRLFAAGITRIADALVMPDFDRLFVRARAEGKLTIPLLRMPGSGHGLFTPPRDRFAEARTGEGPEDFRTGPMKLVFDGGNRCAVCTSFLGLLQTIGQTTFEIAKTRSLAPLHVGLAAAPRVQWNGMVTTGILHYAPEEGIAMVADAKNAGFGVAIHAIGNLALGHAIEALTRAKPHAHPSRIEHATCVDRASLARLRDLGAIVVTQPIFLELPAIANAPMPSGMYFLPFRSLLEAGVTVAGSSDAPAATFDVISAVRAASERRVRPEERIDRRTAFALHTRNAARACGALDVTGTLEVGKRADLVVLSGDPIAGALEGVRVEQTILGGRTVFVRAVSLPLPT